MLFSAARAVGVCLGLSLPAMLAGQQSKTPRTGPSGTAAFYTNGLLIARLGHLNSELRSVGYEGFEHTGSAQGGGGYLLRRGVLFGAQGATLRFGSTTTPGARESRLDGGYALLEAGRVLRSTDDSKLFATVGGGPARLRLTITDPLGVGLGPPVRDPLFNGIILVPGKRSRLEMKGVLLGIGFGADHFMNTRGGFFVGLRGGYRIMTRANQWTLFGDGITDGPSATLTGPYLSLVVGGGSRR